MRTRFRCGSPPEGVNLGPDTVTRRIIMQKARGQAGRSQCPPTARRHGVSGSAPPPDRGSPHLSVALLGSLSVVIECLALRNGPRRFRPGFTCPTLLGYRSGGSASVADGAVTRSGAPFQGTSAGRNLDHSHATDPTTPRRVPPRFRLVPVRSPLLRESLLLSLPPGTEMFQFPGFARAFRDRRVLGRSPGHIAAFNARCPD